ncbi:hypothetical protein HK096_010604 [Nowakowskiella sp. JEL0078]|nr:hypothetical protein HK096_010604 [Nowakowskiella sp. JEL0078]
MSKSNELSTSTANAFPFVSFARLGFVPLNDSQLEVRGGDRLEVHEIQGKWLLGRNLSSAQNDKIALFPHICIT